MDRETPESSVPRGRLGVVVTLWAVSFFVLSRWGAFALPRAVARELSLEAFLAVVHVLTLAAGIGLTAWLVGPPREALRLRGPGPVALAFSTSLSPLVFVAATATAFLIAKPTLLAELLRGGTELAQKSTGEFGRELTRSPALLTVLWGAVLSPLSEELFFRGALFSLVESWFPKALRGAVPVVVVTLVFGLLHWDMPGGLGIVRLVSAFGLGLSCGIARRVSNSTIPSVLMHVSFNFFSIVTVRRWVVTEAFPTKWAVPTFFWALAAVSTAGALALYYALRRRRP